MKVVVGIPKRLQSATLLLILLAPALVSSAAFIENLWTPALATCDGTANVTFTYEGTPSCFKWQSPNEQKLGSMRLSCDSTNISRVKFELFGPKSNTNCAGTAPTGTCCTGWMDWSTFDNWQKGECVVFTSATHSAVTGTTVIRSKTSRALTATEKLVCGAEGAAAPTTTPTPTASSPAASGSGRFSVLLVYASISAVLMART